jgi:hypothetical protein
MIRRRFATVVVPCVIALAMARHACGEPAQPSQKQLDFFETKIRPVLVEHCYECHSSEAELLQGGLLLDSREGLLAGGDSGPAITLEAPAASLLLEALRYESFEMPPDGKLPDSVIADFEQWIEMGAPDPRAGPVAAPRPVVDVEGGREFWCFQPIRSHKPPAVENDAWSNSPVDRFLLAKLESQNLAPAADTDRATWLRRVTFDLIGLPPTPDEIDAFANDASPDAYERVVDRLLASPHFGERWGRHWLDVARFAESSGGGRSIAFKDAWRYRDYVIEAFNRDKPLDEFITEQLAGDLLPHASDAEARDHLVATGYLLLGAHNYEEQDKRALEMDVVDEQLDAISRGILGMTVACARCHDHKFDPIPTADYYALAGIFRSTHVLIHENVSKWTTRPLPGEPADAAAIAAYEKSLAENEAKLVAARASKKPKDAKRVVILEKRIAGMKKTGPPISSCMAVEEAETIEDCRICIRGSVRHRGPAVPRGVLQVATHGEPPKMPPDSSGRHELAEWIVSTQNPLTARVYVNRVWHYLFGAGLVRTVDNFGTTGETPSHPKLLDDLAARFMADGWSTKRLVRELVLSRTYRMSASHNEQAAAADPENRLLWRMNRRRLDAESIRDAMLVTAGKLDLRIGGPNISPEVLANSSPTTPAEYGYEFSDVRRSVYTPAFRNRMHDLFEVFDFADQNHAVGARNVTTSAPQALMMLNSPFVMELADAAAKRILAEATTQSADERIHRAFRETLGRAPTSKEFAIAKDAVQSPLASSQTAAWAQLFQALFGSIDFRYLN